MIISKREKPSFLATTALNVQFALLGLAAQISSGNKIINENQVEDPAIYIANELAKTLESQLGITHITTSTSTTTTNNIKTLAEQHKEADILLDVQTTYWQSIYYTSDWNNYRVVYAAKLRLIDTKNKKVIAESICSKKQDDKKNSPSYDQLIANNAAVLKAALKSHADECISEFKTNALGSI
ncbi:MAG: hypothetical protein KAZ75_02050 [Acinetobacter sp.]|nr:hypothetical protein [Acinetobacter sp.]